MIYDNCFVGEKSICKNFHFAEDYDEGKVWKCKEYFGEICVNIFRFWGHGWKLNMCKLWNMVHYLDVKI